MMGRQSRQMAMVFVDMASLIPENHLLRKIDGMVSFDFIYGLLAPYYSATGRPSVDPVSMFKMLLVGYLYGIKSERRLVEEIRLNIAYRWFCGFELDDAIPDHSTFSKTRTRKWQQSGLFQNAFYEIVKQCIACGLIDGKAMAADGSYIPANVSRESWVDVETEVEQSMQSYLDALDEELSQQPGFKKPPERTIKKRRTTSRTDPDMEGCPMRHALVTTLENTPVIPAVKTPEELPAALRAEGGVVFLLCGDILNIGELIARIHAANRRAVVHADLVAGLAPREIAVDFLQCCGADGIISTRPLLIRRGRELGLLTVLRAFVIDSKAIESLAREAESAAPDVVEMLPAPMPRVVRRLAQSLRAPLIAGGLITDKEDVLAALSAGALCVSTSDETLWSI